MTRPTPVRWRAVKRDWLLGEDSLDAIARRRRVSAKRIPLRAAAENWPPRGSASGNAALVARFLFEDLTDELRRSLDRLRDWREAESPAEARSRTALIRAWLQSLSVLIERERHLPAAAERLGPDEERIAAARAELALRLERLRVLEGGDPPAGHVPVI